MGLRSEKEGTKRDPRWDAVGAPNLPGHKRLGQRVDEVK